MNQMSSEKYLNFLLLVTFWKFQHFNLVSKLSQKLKVFLGSRKQTFRDSLGKIFLSIMKMYVVWTN